MKTKLWITLILIITMAATAWAQNCPIMPGTYSTEINGQNETWLFSNAFVLRQNVAQNTTRYYKLMKGADCSWHLQQANSKGAFKSSPMLTLQQQETSGSTVSITLKEEGEEHQVFFKPEQEQVSLNALMSGNENKDKLTRIDAQYNVLLQQYKGAGYQELYNVNPYLYETDALLVNVRMASAAVYKLFFEGANSRISGSEYFNRRFTTENIEAWNSVLSKLLGEVDHMALIASGQYQDKFEHYIFELHFKQTSDPVLVEMSYRNAGGEKWQLDNLTVQHTGNLDKVVKLTEEVYGALKQNDQAAIEDYATGNYQSHFNAGHLSEISSTLEGAGTRNYQQERIVVKNGTAKIIAAYTLESQGDYMITMELMYQGNTLKVDGISMLSLN